MTHKNKHIKNFLEKSTLFESKFAFYKRKEGDTWEEKTPLETGTAEVESVMREFDERTSPLNLEVAQNHPDEVIHGVRKQMMDGPFNNLNVMSGGAILDQRVRYRLENVYDNAPEAYKHIIQEEVLRRGGPPIDTFWQRGERKRLEREIAGDFFTYNMGAGQNYQTFETNIQAQIQGIGVIGGGAFVDSRGQQINLANPNAVNEFDVAVGPGGVAAGETVVVRWHDEDLITIMNKLKKAGIWADLSRQGGAREFIHLKFRLSLLREIIAEEKSKLNVDRFDPQRLKTWLSNDQTTLALQDQTFQNFVTNNINPGVPPVVPPFAGMEDLQTRDIGLYNQLQQHHEAARARVRVNSLEQLLTDILTPKELENLSTSLETKSMLAYLQASINDPEDGENVRRFIEGLAGRGISDEISENVTEWTNNEKAITDIQTSYAANRGELSNIADTLTTINTRLGALGLSRDTAAEINDLQKQREKFQNRQHELQQSMVNTVWNFRQFVNSNQADPLFATGMASILGVNVPRTANNLLNHSDLTTRPYTPTNIRTFLNIFDNLVGNSTFQAGLGQLLTPTQEQKAKLENQLKAEKAREGKAEKMDSRGLLYKLVRRDLMRKGVTVETGIQKKALLTTNLIVAKVRHNETYGNVNQHIVDALNKGDAGAMTDEMRAMRFFSPILSAKDALEHIVDTDPDLIMFKDIGIYSTRSDLIKMIHRYGSPSPQKLREFQKKIAECIRGIEMEYNPGLVTRFVDKIANLIGVNRKEAPLVKKVRIVHDEAKPMADLMNLLVLLEGQITTNNFLQEVKDEEDIDPDADRAQLHLRMLRQQTEDSMAMDNAVDEAIEGHDALYKTRLDFKKKREEFNEAMDQVEGLPSEDQEEELAREGFNARARARGIISLRARRFLRKAGKGALKYGPLSWPIWMAYGLGLGARATWRFGSKIIYTDQAKESTQKMIEDLKEVPRTPFYPVGWALRLGAYSLSIPGRIFSRISSWGIKKK